MKIFTLDEQDSFPLVGLREAIPTKQTTSKPPLNKSWAFEHIDQTVPTRVKGKPAEAGFNLASPAHNSPEYLKRELHAINYGAEPKPGVYRTATFVWMFDGELWVNCRGAHADRALKYMREHTSLKLVADWAKPRTEPILEVLYVAE